MKAQLGQRPRAVWTGWETHFPPTSAPLVAGRKVGAAAEAGVGPECHQHMLISNYPSLQKIKG